MKGKGKGLVVEATVQRNSGEQAAGGWQPLAGLRIFDLCTYVAGPSATMTLAQLGAEVIRIDPIGGAADTRRSPLTDDGTSLYWTGLNKAKQSVELDLRSPAGREVFFNLLARSGAGGGIVVTNAVGQRWLGFDQLRQHRDDVILVQIAGRGDGTPAVDYTVNCEVGFPFLTGPALASEPTNHVLPAWDLLTGLHAAIAVIAAQRSRSLDGAGQYISVNLGDVAVATIAQLGMLAEIVVNGTTRRRDGNFFYGGFGRDFATADGQRIMVVALTDRHFHALVRLAGVDEAVSALEGALCADFGRDEDRYQHREVLAALIAPWFAERTLADTAAVLDEHKVLWGQYRGMDQLLSSGPHSADLLVDIDQPNVGTIPVPRSVLRTADPPGRPSPAPVLGEHTREVLQSIGGYCAARVTQLSDDGVIGPSNV